MKTALVTGGAKRIGKAIVEDLAAHGFAVAIHANGSQAEAEDLASQLRAKGTHAAAVVADLTDTASVLTLMDQAKAAIGPVGLLVNNASLFKKDSLEEFDEDIWDGHFALHVKAPSLLAVSYTHLTLPTTPYV